MSKQTKAQANDSFMGMMRDKGFETVFQMELPYPMNTRNCQLILARVGNIIHIRSEA